MAHLMQPVNNEVPVYGPKPPRRKFILCFDGTGNKFLGNAGDSNILKIYSMLDKTDETQFHYYQPGIGTYTTGSSLSSDGFFSRFLSWYRKSRDSAIGITIDEHVMAGYRFLMRYYQTGDDIYLFGFSRGAYIARFLAEMLDHIGLLSSGNEELVRFVWETFAKWQERQGGESEAEKKKVAEMHKFMTDFRETFSRPIRRIRFLGLFDTVNSVSRFETAWMQRSKKFPYTARSSAIVIRHAVSIDERRAKFRQDLIYQKRGRHSTHSSHNPQDGGTTARFRPRTRARSRSALRPETGSSTQPSINHDELCNSDDEDEAQEQDIQELWFPGGHGDIGGGWATGPENLTLAHGPLVWMVREAQKSGLIFIEENMQELRCYHDDLAEGGIAGNGLATAENENGGGEPSTISVPEIDINDTIISAASSVPGPSQAKAQPERTRDPSNNAHFFSTLHQCATQGLIHDSLTLRSTLPPLTVLAWNIMEYLPFRRLDLLSDGSGRWRVIRWPLPMGEVRDIPDDAHVHGSTIARLAADASYRPGNLIDGGGGRGSRQAKQEWLLSEWVCLSDGATVAQEGGVAGTGGFGEVWVKRKWWENNMARRDR